MVTYIFYFIIIVCILSSLILKKTKKFYRKEKKYRSKSARNRYSVMQIITTTKITTLRTLYIYVISNSVMFPQILHDIVLYARHFLPVKVFSPSITFINYVSSYRKM